MKQLFILSIAWMLACGSASLSAAERFNSECNQPEYIAGGEYTLVVDGFDWGPGVNGVIISMEDTLSEADPLDYSVYAERKTDCKDLEGDKASGERTIVNAYVSDEWGNPVEKGTYLTLVLFVSPLEPLTSPFVYTDDGKCDGNSWVDYRVTITDRKGNRFWDRETGRISRLMDRFDLTGRYRYSDTLTMSYAFYRPGKSNGSTPLIIWLHGGGEGGTDLSLPLLANRAANYASDEIQAIFEGAFVLVPQCPGAWMDNKKGVMTHGKEDDVYHVALMQLIRDFVAGQPDIDPDRIYVGGCSNGGYMSLKLIMDHPGYFAAGFISALAYQSRYISDEKIESIRNVPIWFVHSADDSTTIPEKTVLPVFQRLKEAGAENVHLSYYDHVIDITGFYGGEGLHQEGHWSWIYCHANLCRRDYDGSLVEVNGKPVTIMEWLAAQSR